MLPIPIETAPPQVVQYLNDADRLDSLCSRLALLTEECRYSDWQPSPDLLVELIGVCLTFVQVLPYLSQYQLPGGGEGYDPSMNEPPAQQGNLFPTGKSK